MQEAPIDLQEYLEKERVTIEQLTFDLAQIPAPSYHEEEKATFCKQFLEDAGADNVYLDKIGNLIWPYACDQFDDVVVFMAHIDTVFSAETPLNLRINEDIAACPGIWDDSANDAVLLVIAKYIAQNRPATNCGLLFVWDVCEEAPGGLAGIRQLLADWRERIVSLISFDGSNSEIISGAMGTKSFQISLQTPGGHPTINSENANAVERMSRLVTRLYDTPLIKGDGILSARNAYRINGGDSINTISEKAELFYEIRSNEQTVLNDMEKDLMLAIQELSPSLSDISVKILDIIPCATVDKKLQQALVERMREAIRIATGKRLPDRPGSTDCNVSLAMGIPSVAYCTVKGENAHTEQEFYYRSSQPEGALAAATFISSYFSDNSK